MDIILFNTISSKLKTVLDIETDSQLSEKLDLSKASFNNLKHRNSYIKIIEKVILHHPSISIDYLIYNTSSYFREAQLVAQEEMKIDELDDILKDFINKNSNEKNKQELLNFVLESIQRQKGQTFFIKLFNKVTGSYSGFLVALYSFLKSIDKIDISNKKEFNEILDNFEIPKEIERLLFKSHLDLKKVKNFFQQQEMTEIDILEIKYNSIQLQNMIKKQLSKPNQYLLEMFE